MGGPAASFPGPFPCYLCGDLEGSRPTTCLRKGFGHPLQGLGTRTETAGAETLDSSTVHPSCGLNPWRIVKQVLNK